MDSWKFESDSTKQTLLSLACIATGLALAIGFRHFNASGMANSLAGFLLGLLLLGIGIAAFVTRGTQRIIFDQAKRQIVVEDTAPFGAKRRQIPFGDIVGTGIGYLGRKSGFVTLYYINLKLRGGEEYPLFAPGRFFDGGSDRSVMESRRLHLEQLVGLRAGR